MNLKTIIESAISRGASSEEAMWQSVASVDDLLCEIQEDAPKKYWKFIRKVYCNMNGKHYDEEFARHDVAELRYIDRDGAEAEGGHWSPSEVESATSRMSFTPSTTKWDKYVALNAAYAYFCRHFTDEQVIEIAHDFFFADEDWPDDGKTWQYMSLRHTI